MIQNKYLKKDINILLVMPKVDIGYQDWPIPPVGITYVSASLKKAGYRVLCMNLNLEDDDYYEHISGVIKDNSINVVGTGGLVVNYHAIKKIVDIVKSIDNDIITWVGGSLMTFSAMPVMKGIQNIDIGMLGEGEITACEMIDVLSKEYDKDALEKVHGLAIRKNDGTVTLTAVREEIEDLDMIPYPDYDGFHFFDMIQKFWETDKTGIISVPLTTSRSCPFNCTFCSKSGGSKYRQRKLDAIFEELEYIIQKYNVNRIYLNDELFANDYNRIKEFCERIKQYNIKWFVFLRISRHITTDLLLMMKDSGCIQILYGLESGDDRILSSVRKGTTTEEMVRVVKLTNETGFQVRGNFIFGDTNETLDTVKTTLSFVETYSDYFASVAFSPIVLYPGSFLYKKAVKEGVITDELDFIEKECPVTNVSKMSNEEYQYMLNTLLPEAKIKQVTTSPHDIKGFCADVDSKAYCYEKKCDLCGTVNKYFVTPTANLMRQNQHICPDCGATIIHNVVNEYAKLLYLSLKKVLQKYKVAFWGVGQNLQVLFTIMKQFEDEYGCLDSFILVDMSKDKVGMVWKTWGGEIQQVIHHPDDMKDFNIEYVR